MRKSAMLGAVALSVASFAFAGLAYAGGAGGCGGYSTNQSVQAPQTSTTAEGAPQTVVIAPSEG